MKPLRWCGAAFYNDFRYSPGDIILNGSFACKSFSVLKCFLSRVIKKSAFCLIAPRSIGRSFSVIRWLYLIVIDSKRVFSTDRNALVNL